MSSSRRPVSPTMIVHWSLYALIVLLLAGAGYGVYMMHQKLSSYATEVNRLSIDSELNQQSIENAKKLRRILDENQENVTRAAAIVADTQYYQYQDQIVQDVTSYASASGLTVLGFDFSTTGKTGKSRVSGVKTVVATVTLQNPVPYTNYIKLLKLIERNLTKMQVTQLDISNDLKAPGTISSPVITLEVYVR